MVAFTGSAPAHEQYGLPAEQEPIIVIHEKYSQNTVSFAEWLSVAADRGARRHRHCCDVFGVNGIARFIVEALRDLGAR